MTVAGLSTAKGRTFYETSAAASGKYMNAGALDLGNKTKINANTNVGDYIGACHKDGLAKGKDSWKYCYSMSSVFEKTTGPTYKTAAMANRVMLTTATITGNKVVCGDETSKTECFMMLVDPDLILGSFYQSNGAQKTDGTTWCSGDFHV